MVSELWIEFVLMWFILFPAYATNCFPPVLKGKRPLDRKKTFFDKHRIFGDGKTIEGTIGGILFGFFIGLLEIYLLPYLQNYANNYNVLLPNLTLIGVLFIALGAMFGDLFGSFVKRRLKIESGGKFHFDQIGFIIFVFLFIIPFIKFTILMLVYALVLTFVLHRIVNIIGFRLKLKKVPW